MAKDIMPPALTEDSCNKTYIRIIKKKRKPNFLRNNLKTSNLGIAETDYMLILSKKFEHVCSGLHHLVFQEDLDPEIDQPNKEKGHSDPRSQADHLLNSQGSDNPSTGQ